MIKDKKTSTCLARLEGTAIEVNKMSFATVLLSPVLTASNNDRVVQHPGIKITKKRF